jgi:adenylyl cyclase-associated protein
VTQGTSLCSQPPKLLCVSASGLRKVTDNMKTHKNPELRGSSVVKAGGAKKTDVAPPKFGSAVSAKKPPVLALQGKKWIVVSV